MKKISVMILAMLTLAVAPVLYSADSGADLEVQKLRAEIKERSSKYEKQVKIDMGILAKLRMENRELKTELRKLKMSMATADKKVSSDISEEVADKKAKIEEKTAKAEEKATYTPKDSVKSIGEKNDSVWNHMFPF